MNKGKRVVSELPRHFLAVSEVTIPIGIDGNNPNLFIGLGLIAGANHFEISGVDGSVKNILGKTIEVMTGTISFQPVKPSGTAVTLHIWSERSIDGITWTQNEKSLRPLEIGNVGDSMKTNVSYIRNFLDGEYVRFRAYCKSGGAINLVPPTDAVLGGQIIEGYSVTWELLEE